MHDEIIFWRLIGQRRSRLCKHQSLAPPTSEPRNPPLVKLKSLIIGTIAMIYSSGDVTRLATFEAIFF